MNQGPQGFSVSPGNDTGVDRRRFLQLAGSATALVARSYARVIGANDRIRLAQLGCGGHVHMVRTARDRTPVEVVAVCDIWSLARERRAAQVRQLFGAGPRVY